MQTIKASELRIGNKVMYDTMILDVAAISRFIQLNNEELDIDINVYIFYITPIPLTEDILLKCGFEKSLLEENNPDEGYYFSLNFKDEKYCDLSFISGDKNGILEVCLFPYENHFRYKFLHQIQNVFYSLTGEELPYKH